MRGSAICGSVVEHTSIILLFTRTPQYSANAGDALRLSISIQPQRAPGHGTSLLRPRSARPGTSSPSTCERWTFSTPLKTMLQ